MTPAPSQESPPKIDENRHPEHLADNVEVGNQETASATPPQPRVKSLLHPPFPAPSQESPPKVDEKGHPEHRSSTALKYGTKRLLLHPNILCQ
jgi:hypothetical protein